MKKFMRYLVNIYSIETPVTIILIYSFKNNRKYKDFILFANFIIDICLATEGVE